MMEDGRYHWRKQNGPGFIGNATGGGPTTKSNDHEGDTGEGEADEFDAKPREEKETQGRHEAKYPVKAGQAC